jgi:hypothetical protein
MADGLFMYWTCGRLFLGVPRKVPVEDIMFSSGIAAPYGVTKDSRSWWAGRRDL